MNVPYEMRSRRSLFCLLMVTFFAWTIIATGEGIAAPPVDNIQLHLSWKNDPRTSMMITWWSSTSFTPTVRYGLTASYELGSVVGTSNALTTSTGIYHHVELTGLSPNTTYHYQAGSPSAGWSADHMFKTAPSGTTPFVFTAYGDQDDSTAEAAATAKRVLEANPAFNLVAGDIAYDSWTSWFNMMEPVSSTRPTMASRGNHDTPAAFLEHFEYPNNERWYSFDYGNAHFIALETDYDIPGTTQNPAQLAWLENDLKAAAANPSRVWTVVYFHFPAFSYGTDHGGTAEVVSSFVPLFDLYHVDLVIDAHAHNYQRSYPLKNKVVTDTSKNIYTDPTGTIYALVGTGGRNLRALKTTVPSWAAFGSASLFGFLRVTVNGSTLTAEQINNTDGQPYDHFTIIKGPKSDTVPPSAPAGLKIN